MLADFNRAVESDQVLVVCTQAEVAGYVVSYQRRDDLFIENIAVSPDFQRQGLADLMLDHLYQVATAAGCRNVVLYTNVKMTENLAWYAKRGYRETHRLHEDGFDRVYLCKNLQ